MLLTPTCLEGTLQIIERKEFSIAIAKKIKSNNLQRFDASINMNKVLIKNGCTAETDLKIETKKSSNVQTIYLTLLTCYCSILFLTAPTFSFVSNVKKS